MNWTEIKEKYPKRVNEFINWFRPRIDISDWDKEALENTILIGSAGYVYDLKMKGMLYDFFDEQDIFIDIEYGKPESKWLFKPTICAHFLNDRYAFMVGFKTRKQAETAAFTKAFEILESK